MIPIFLLMIAVHQSSSEFRYCPEPWVSNEQSCYKFVFYPYQTYDGAKLACGDDGASLLSVNTVGEHSFISNWLHANDVGAHRWFTSGILYDMEAGDLQWKGDGTRIQYSDQYWLNSMEKDKPGLHLVYTYAVTGYLWGRDAESAVLPYICEISMDEAYKIANTQRDYGPDFILQPTSLVVVGEAETATFECVATGNPAPHYTINFIDQENNRSVISPEVDSRYTVTNGKVTIQYPNERNDSGIYQCKAENSFGIILGNVMHLTFGTLGSFSNVDREPVTALSHESAQINCGPPIHKPAVMYQWLRDRTNSFVRPDLTPYLFISRSGKLYFSVVSKEDEDRYYCVVKLTSANGAAIGSNQPPSRTSLPIQLIVMQQVESVWGPEIGNDFPAVFPPRPIRGQNVYMECLAYGTMTIHYTWSRQYLPMPTTVTFLDYNRVLMMEGAQIEDSGIYTCHASRGVAASVSKSFYLTIEAKPFFSYPLRDQHVDIGSQLTWRCEAKAFPAPTYTWYKNGVKATNIPGEITINKNVLLIDNLDPDRHNGMYQCSATNVYGEVFTEGQLRVLAFKPTFSKRPLEERMFGAIGGNATIICDPEAAPFPDFAWRKNGVDLGVNHGDTTSRLRLLQNGNLLIQTVGQSDAGLYTCMAANTYGSDSSSTTLSVTPSTSITVAPQPTTVQVNHTAFLSCSASVSSQIEFVQTWNFNGVDLDLTDSTYFTLGTSQNVQGLYIRHAQLVHSGDYECVIMTTMDSSRANARLTVLGPSGAAVGVYADPTTITAHTLTLKWTVGALNGLPVSFHMVEARPERSETWTVVVPFIPDISTIVPGYDKRVAEVSGLKPGVGYTFRVSSANGIGIGQPSVPSDIFQTLPAAPSVPPGDVGGGGGSVGDLSLTWTPLEEDDWGGSIIAYNVYWRRLGNVVSWIKAIVDSPSVGKYVVNVGQENYYSQYEVKLQAFNIFGKGPNSSVAIVYSAEDIPIAVATNVFASRYNSTAITVTWNPVPDVREIMLGKLLGYQVNYFARNTSDPIINFISWRTSEPKGLVIGLLPNTWYTFDVQVLNTAGRGQISEKYHQRTYQNAPLLYPTEVRVHSHGANSVLVTWRGVSTGINEEPLQGFKLRYWLNNDDIRTARDVVVGKVDQAAIIGVEKDNLYKIRMLGYSQGGDGNLGQTVYFTLGGMVYVDPTVSEIRAGADQSAFPISILLLCVTLTVTLS